MLRVDWTAVMKLNLIFGTARREYAYHPPDRNAWNKCLDARQHRPTPIQCLGLKQKQCLSTRNSSLDWAA